jgi:hypothetical protein
MANARHPWFAVLSIFSRKSASARRRRGVLRREVFSGQFDGGQFDGGQSAAASSFTSMHLEVLEPRLALASTHTDNSVTTDTTSGGGPWRRYDVAGGTTTIDTWAGNVDKTGGKLSGNYIGPVVIPSVWRYTEDVGYNDFRQVTRYKTITGIQASAFDRYNGYFVEMANFTSVVVPASVQWIGEKAFQQQDRLNWVRFLGNAPNIGNGTAFNMCNSLTRVYHASTVTGFPADGERWCFRKGDPDSHGLIAMTDYWVVDGVITKYGGPGGDIEIPDTITGEKIVGIGANAFANVRGVTGITIPDSVTSIGAGAFADCTYITSVTIGDGVKSIGSGAFQGCTRLRSVSIGSSVTSIGASVFQGCTQLVAASGGGNVTSIGDSAFEGCTALPKVTGGKKLTTIGNEAFRGCTAATSATIPNTVTKIGTGVFAGCTKLETAKIGNRVTRISNGMFADCTALRSVSIPTSVTSIGTTAFQGCTNLNTVTIPKNVSSIGASAFSGSTILTSVNFLGNAPTVGTNAFAGVATEAKAYRHTYQTGFGAYGADFYGLTVTKNGAASTDFKFSNGVITGYTGDGGAVTIPTQIDGQSVKSIGKDAFRGVTSLTSVIIPDTATIIHKTAFYNCTNLRTASLGDGVKTISDDAFNGCTKLATVTFGSSVRVIGKQAFRYCSALTKLTFPASLNHISDRAFQHATRLNGVAFAGNAPSTGGNVFSNVGSNATAIRNATLTGYGDDEDDWNGLTVVATDYVVSAGGVITLYTGSGGDLSIPTAINGLAIVGIGDHAFADITGLTSVTMPDGVTSIGAGSFAGCTSLTSVTLGSGLRSIGASAFRNATSLANVSLGNGVTSIDGLAFSHCHRLTSLVVPKSVTGIGHGAFLSCSTLATVWFEGNAPTVGPNVFSSVAANAKAYRNSSQTGFGSDGAAWNGLTVTPTDYAVTGGVITLYTGSAGDLEIPAVINGQTIVGIGSSAFSGRTSLTSVVLPDSITSIGANAFSGATSLASVTFNANAPSVGTNAFATIAAGAMAYRAATLTGYGANGATFYGLAVALTPSPATGFTLSDGVITAYSGPGGDVVIPSTIGGQTVVGIGSHAFQGTRLTSVVIPDSVTSIESDAVSLCSTLTSVTFGKGLTSIGSYAFQWCNALASVTFTANAPSVGTNAFQVSRTPHPIAYRAATLTGYGIDGSIFKGLTVATPST